MNHSELIRELIVIIRNNKDRISLIENVRQGQIFIFNLLQNSLNEVNEHIILNLSNLITNFLFVNKIEVEGLLKYLEEEFNDPYDRQTVIREKEDGFDDKFGTITGVIKQQFELSETISMERFKNSAKYHPTPVKSMYLALDSLKLLDFNFEESVFIDVGSGMGRCLLIASEYSFDKIIGVEISEYLHQIAIKNIEIYQNENQKCRNIRSYCCDIFDFDIPDNKSVVFYFWEPFPDAIFDQFYEKLVSIAAMRGCKITLIFLGRVFPTVESSTVFKRKKKLKSPDKAKTQKEVEPASNGSDSDLYYYYLADNYYLTIYSNK